MKLLLHVTQEGAQLWQKGREGWQPQHGDAPGPVWVLTDLAEEGFSEIQVPRLFGRDRQTFLARQLASRFPDTPYRGLLPAKLGGGLMERLAPPLQTAQGLDAPKRLDAALATLSGPLAGVWLTSILLATIGAKKGMPPELFVALPRPDGLRLVVLKDRVPVLSRWIPGVTEPRTLASEIVRTVRHLENTRVLDRSAKPRSVLILGDSTGMAELLATDNVYLMAPPAPWSKVAPGDWHFALFDLIVASPFGQVAPLSQRTDFVASRLSRVAFGAAAASLALAVWLGVDATREILTTQSSRQQLESRVRGQQAKIDEVDEGLAKFGVSADLVREAAALDTDEIRVIRPFANDLMQLAHIVSRLDAVRLQQYSWRLMAPGQVACASETQVGTVPAPIEGLPPQRLVEVQLTATLPENQRERARAQMISGLSAQLRQLRGAALLTDPAQAQLNAALKGGDATSGPTVLPAWCLTLPVQPAGEPHKGTAQ
jgi:hypothetical protein